jgi:nucleoid DNA-binding protein
VDRSDKVVKADLIKRIAKENPKLSEADCRRLIDVFFNAMIDQISQDGAIQLRGFGSFAVKRYVERMVRNPRTGAIISIHKIVRVGFRTSRLLLASLQAPSLSPRAAEGVSDHR